MLQVFNVYQRFSVNPLNSIAQTKKTIEQIILEMRIQEHDVF